MDERIELAEMHAASIRIETLQANLDSLEPRVSVAQHLPTERVSIHPVAEKGCSRKPISNILNRTLAHGPY